MDGTRLFAFGTTPGKAVQQAKKIQGDTQIVQEYVRFEGIDQFSPGPCPIKRLILEMDFSFICLNCNCKVNDEMFNYETSEVLAPVYLDAEQTVFCTTKCQAKYLRKQHLKLH